MHEAAFSHAALPAPAVVLGLNLKPYSIGHEVFLFRENNPIVAGVGPVKEHHLFQAALICCQTFAECQAMNHDWLIGWKLKLWKWRVRNADFLSELASFSAYRVNGSQEFRCNEIKHEGKIRYAGAPMLLRLQQFVMTHLGKSEAAAWDYPLGLAKMRWAAHYEAEGALEVYNHHDAEFDRFCAEMEAKEKENTCRA